MRNFLFALALAAFVLAATKLLVLAVAGHWLAVGIAASVCGAACFLEIWLEVSEAAEQ